MPSRAYYLQQAKVLFDMASMSAKDVRDRWIERANEYVILADALGDDPVPEVPLPETQPQVMPSSTSLCSMRAEQC